MSHEINVVSRTQQIIVEPTSGSVSVINAGPPGPGLAIMTTVLFSTQDSVSMTGNTPPTSSTFVYPSLTPYDTVSGDAIAVPESLGLEVVTGLFGGFSLQTTELGTWFINAGWSTVSSSGLTVGDLVGTQLVWSGDTGVVTNEFSTYLGTGYQVPSTTQVVQSAPPSKIEPIGVFRRGGSVVLTVNFDVFVTRLA
jgi:hypothetical protein